MMATHCILVIVSVIFLIAAKEFGGTEMMTISHKLVILPKGVYYRETHKHIKNKNKMMEGSTDVLFVVYIRTINMTKHSSTLSIIINHVQNHSYEEIH